MVNGLKVNRNVFNKSHVRSEWTLKAMEMYSVMETLQVRFVTLLVHTVMNYKATIN